MIAHNFINLTGRKAGRWTVIERVENTSLRATQWRCVCECGTVRIVNGSNLHSGKTKSCGCLHREIAKERNTKHGMFGTPEYTAWAGMIYRCTNPNCQDFENYGGRGILVSDEW